MDTDTDTDTAPGTGEAAGAPRPPARRWWRVLVLCLAVCGGAGAGAGYVVWRAHQPLPVAGETLIQLQGGTSLRGFVADLHRRGLVVSPLAARVYAHALGLSRSLKAGEYRVEPQTTWDELLRTIVAGRGVHHAFLIVEGWTFSQARAALRQARGVQQTLDGASDQEVMARLGQPGVHPEGRLLPDTYHYQSGTSDLELLRLAHDSLNTVLAKEWEGRDPAIPLTSPEQALVLASIVEKETARTEERELIAGVFTNRLRRGMRLQTDPTVIYGLGAGFDGNLRSRDLQADGPYNTYTRAGLPPTPIALAGRAALHAAVHPAQTTALFFVSRGDGTHQFSDTLEAHNDAVVRYQLNGRRPGTSQ